MKSYVVILKQVTLSTLRILLHNTLAKKKRFTMPSASQQAPRAKSPPDERLVYLSLKNVFRGQDAQLRISKKIAKLIQQQVDDGATDLSALVAEHGFDPVCATAKALLQKQVFESTLQAKIRFPEVFEVSPAQSVERAASEVEAARDDANAIRDAAEGCQATRATARVDVFDFPRRVTPKQPGMSAWIIEARSSTFGYI